jgi:glutamate racemase
MIQSICGKNIKIINSANAVAYEVKKTLEQNKIENIEKNRKNRDVRLYVSDFNDTVFYLTELILGNKYPLKKIELVDIFGSSSK